MLKNYLIYLDYINVKIQQIFEAQKTYICCKKGCAKCCRQARFPYSRIEFEHIYQGLLALAPDIQQQVLGNVDKIIIEKQKHNCENPQEKFLYDCPFLINNECSVYDNRGLICRIFGLLTFVNREEKELNIPFCAYEGLNYSGVIDKVQNKVSKQKSGNTELSPDVMAYNLDYSTLINEKNAKIFGIEFGEVKPLVEWFIKWKEELVDKTG